MIFPHNFEAIDYLMIGHLTKDLGPKGYSIGGTAAYSALTAHALGLKVGIVTSWGGDLDLAPLKPIPLAGLEAEASTTFENLETPQGRTQRIFQVAEPLDYYLIPDRWRSTPIVHLGPIAQEVEPTVLTRLEENFIGITPQGWLREWDESGLVKPSEWPEARYVLNRSNVAVISAHDFGFDQSRLEELASACDLLAITQGDGPIEVYWRGEFRQFHPPSVEVVDTTGAGDIFAAVFFIHFYRTEDPWESAEFAMRLASISAMRRGLDGIPTAEEIRSCLTGMEV